MWSRLPWILFGYAGIVLDEVGCRAKYKNNTEETVQKTNEISDKNIFYDFVKNSLITNENN